MKRYLVGAVLAWLGMFAPVLAGPKADGDLSPGDKRLLGVMEGWRSDYGEGKEGCARGGEAFPGGSGGTTSRHDS